MLLGRMTVVTNIDAASQGTAHSVAVVTLVTKLVTRSGIVLTIENNGNSNLRHSRGVPQRDRHELV